MGMRSAVVVAVGAVVFGVGCGGPSGPNDGSAPGSRGGTPGAGGGGTAPVSIAVDRQGPRDDGFDAVSFDVARVIAFHDDAPGRPDDGAPCFGANAVRHEVSFRFDLDLHGAGRSDIGRFDLEAGHLTEVRLLVRAAEVEEHGRQRHGRGRLTCRDDDGTVFILVRLVPTERIDLERDRGERLVARFDDRNDLDEEACESSSLSRRADREGDECEVEDDHGGDDHGGQGGDDHGGDDHGGDLRAGASGAGAARQGSRVVLADTLPLSRDR
jgi:hypothetical protein